MRHVLRRLGLARRITKHAADIRELLHSALEQTDGPESHSHHNVFPRVFELLDMLQQFLSPDGKVPEISDYEERPPEQVKLSLSELLVIFYRTLHTLHQQASHATQRDALEILHSYFIELQGLYDLVSVRGLVSESTPLPFSLSALEEQHRRYFRCFRITEQALSKLRQDGVPDEILTHLRNLAADRPITEEQLTKALVREFGKTQGEQYRYLIMKHAQMLRHLTADPLIREYQSIPFSDLMNISAAHHFRVAFFHLLPRALLTAFAERFHGKPRCRGLKPARDIATVAELQQFFLSHPLTESARLGVAFHRHVMRIADILGTRAILTFGRPVFELLVLGTWIQTVKDHILPGHHRPDWQAERLNLAQDVAQQVDDSDSGPGTVRLSSAFFMQPRVKFGLERFLIFKLRSMTVGDIVRVTEFGNWMRKNSADEFLQFFNIAMGDMGGLGIRTMPEHEIVEDEDTLWLYSALMSFVPGGATSPGSNIMRQHGYDLTKKEQLFHEIRFYDPRFKRSSNVLNDLLAVFGSIAVLGKGRDEAGLRKTESFEVVTITAKSLEALRAAGAPERVLTGLRAIENHHFPKPDELLRALEDHLGADEIAAHKALIIRYLETEKRDRGI